jgi:hypothetical protein
VTAQRGRSDAVGSSAVLDARGNVIRPLQDDDTVDFIFSYGDSEAAGAAEPDEPGPRTLGIRRMRSR